MTPTDPDDEFLTVAEVAAMLKLNQQTVRNWIDQGTLSAVRIGRRVRIRRVDLDRLLNQDYRAASAAPATVHLSADDFWGGEPVGSAMDQPEPAGPGAAAAPVAGKSRSATAATAETTTGTGTGTGTGKEGGHQ
jgi:excisionase family DNA binding protein